MAHLYPSNLRVYHPLDSLTDSQSNVWSIDTGTPDFSNSGVIDSGMLTVNSNDYIKIASTYGGISGTQSITVCGWVKNNASATHHYHYPFCFSSDGFGDLDAIGWGLLSGSDKLTIYQNAGIHQTSYARPTDSDWHFIVVDVRKNGSLAECRVSVDGSGWSSPFTWTWANWGASSQAWIIVQNNQTHDLYTDEVAWWIGNDLFTSDELLNLYQLGAVHEVGLDQYSNQNPETVSSSGDLYINGYSTIGITYQASGDLFSIGNLSYSSSGDLYINAFGSTNTTCDLFINGSPENVFGINTNCDLFIHGYTDYANSGDLYVQGVYVENNSANCYMFGSYFAPQIKLFWGEADTDVIKFYDLLTGQTSTIVDTNINYPVAMEVDYVDRKLYWIDYGTDQLKKSNFDGSDIEVIVEDVGDIPYGLALDQTNRKVYYPDRNAGDIYVVNMDGSNHIKVASGQSSPAGIAVDEINSKLYWTERVENGSLKRSDLDGNNSEYLISGSLSYPSPLAIYNNHIYWSNYGFAGVGATIERSNLDGSDQTTIIPSGTLIDVTYGLKIDSLNQKMYIGDWNLDYLARANCDGTDFEVLISGAAGSFGPQGIAIYSESQLPECYISGKDSKQASVNLFLYCETVASGDLFIEGFALSGASGDLFTRGYSDIQISGNLFTQGMNQLAVSGDLVIAGHTIASSNVNLYLANIGSHAASGNFYINGFSEIATSGDLFIRSHDQFVATGDLFVGGYVNIQASGDLYTCGHISAEASGDLYTHGHTTTSKSGALFIAGGQDLLLYICGSSTAYEHSASGDLFLHGDEEASASGDLFIHGYTTTSGRCSLITYGHDTPTLYIYGHVVASGLLNLFVVGDDDRTAQRDLYTAGHESIVGSGDLFVHGIYADTARIDLFMSSPEPSSGNHDLFVHGVAPASGASGGLAKPIDWLLRAADHHPQIIGTFETPANLVNIQVWDITNGENTPVSVASSGCYQIGNTGRWGWSTANLPTVYGHARQYFYIMTSDATETFDGQFFMDTPEGAKWVHPRGRGDYLV